MVAPLLATRAFHQVDLAAKQGHPRRHEAGAAPPEVGFLGCQPASVIMAAPTVALVASSMRIMPPVIRFLA